MAHEPFGTSRIENVDRGSRHHELAAIQALKSCRRDGRMWLSGQVYHQVQLCDVARTLRVLLKERLTGSDVTSWAGRVRLRALLRAAIAEG